MEILIGLAIGFSIGFPFGWHLREKFAEAKVNKYLKEIAKEENQINDTLVLDVHVEHDTFYLYDKKDNKFITQVKNKEEMFDYFNKTHPNRNVVIAREQLALFDTV